MSVVVIDQGGQSTRGIVYDESGVQQAIARRAITTTRDGTHVEHDALEVLSSVESVLQESRKRAHDSISTVGLATQRSTLLFWDARTGDPLSPAVSWQDRRAASDLESLGLDVDEFHARTGLRPTPYYGASKLRWFLDREPNWRCLAADGSLRAGPLSSWLTLQLTQGSPGHAVVDPANAQRTLLWNLRDRDWDPELCRLFAIPRELLPRSVKTTGLSNSSPFGPVALAGGAPLALVTGDQSAAVFADGVPRTDVVTINLGTGAFLQRPLPPGECWDSPSSRLLTSVVRVDSAGMTCVEEGVVNGAAAALEQCASKMRVALESLPTWLDEVSDPPLFLNGVAGLGSPDWIAGFSSRWIGGGTEAARLVAVAESIVFGVVRNLEVMAADGAIETIHVTGGLSNVSGLLERLASLTPATVYRRNDPEATARGVALQLLSPLAESAVKSITKVERRTIPEIADRYRRWTEAMEAAIDERT